MMELFLQKWLTTKTKILNTPLNTVKILGISDALHDLVPFVQF